MSRLAVVVLVGLVGCTKPVEGESLLETGLCVDLACSEFSPDVLEYEPRFELWANTSTKRRWLHLPPGTRIDTSDMNHWVFPVGTKAWKEFTRDGVRVETRYIVKTLEDDSLPDAWTYGAYAWNDAQSDARNVLDGRANANGTMHDIPDEEACFDCHDHLRPSKLLGVEAIQLDFDSVTTDLQDLVDRNLLTVPPAGPAPYFPLPGDATTKEAFGYLHGNCGGCHSPRSDNANETPLDLRLDTTKLATVEQTPTYLTTVNAPTLGDFPGIVVRPRDPDNSVLIQLMNSSEPIERMPPVAIEIVDPTGQAALRAWINSL